MRAAILAICGLTLAGCNSAGPVKPDTSAAVPPVAAPAPSSLDQKIASVSAQIAPYCGAAKVGIALLQPSIKKPKVAQAVEIARREIGRFCDNPVESVPEAVQHLAAIATDLAAVYAVEAQ
jgi:hypothetical protein